jgi:hypothetical protein
VHQRSRPIEDILPVSALQEGLLFHSAYEENGPDIYTEQLAIDIEGSCDAVALKEAAAALVRRHSILRAGFRQRKSGDWVQVVHREAALRWQETDLRGVAEPERAAAVQRLMLAERSERFDLSSPPLMRFHLLTLGPDRFRIVLTNPHVLLDGWSMPVLLRDLLSVYVGVPPERPAPPYRDYLQWLVRQDRERADAAWRAALHGLDAPTRIGSPEGNRDAVEPARVHVALSEACPRPTPRP